MLSRIFCKCFGHSPAFIKDDINDTSGYPCGKSVCLVCKRVLGGVGNVIVTVNIDDLAGKGGAGKCYRE